MQRTGWVAYIIFVIVVAAGVIAIHVWRGGPQPTPEAGGDQGGQAADGGTSELKIWVPAGLVGDYWLYVNGRIESEASGGGPPEWASYFNDWEKHRRYIRSGNERLVLDEGDFKVRLPDYFHRNVDPAGGDTKHLFTLVDMARLPAGNYTVDAVYIGGRSLSSFPFSITRTYTVTVTNGQVGEVVVGVPADWDNSTKFPAIWLACDGLGRPIADNLERTMDHFVHDPVVHALRGASLPPPPGDAVILDMPDKDGGPRAYNRAQIALIANAILATYNTPSHADIVACKATAPQFAQSLDAYDQLLGDFDGQLDPIRALARE